MKSYYSIILLSLTFLFLFTFSIAAQTTDSDLDNSLNANSNHIFDVYFFNGYGIAYKIFTFSDSEIRIGLDLSSSYHISEYDATKNHLSNDNKNVMQTHSSELTRNNLYLNFSPHYLLNLYKSNFGRSYFGVGPFFGYHRQKSSSDYDSFRDNNDFSKGGDLYLEISYSFGIALFLGINGNLSNSISVFAESQLSGGRSWSDGESENKNSSESHSSLFSEIYSNNGWFYNLTLVRVGFRFSI